MGKKEGGRFLQIKVKLFACRIYKQQKNPSQNCNSLNTGAQAHMPLKFLIINQFIIVCSATKLIS